MSTRDSRILAPWRTRGACYGMSVERFFPIGERGSGAIQAAAAKTICAGCVVSADCLDAALVVPDTDGIWGGLTSSERRALRLAGRVVRSAADRSALVTARTS